ncbi:Urease accessory protein UreD [Haliangium ochraceum DSM 14365]|uniref:Urease accessory protein UreD n=2 Tax=Haliangium ochraceum TaxID=80816 RepID=D0LX10_HALO1|nr:Urease accessory protein UreD [Haliangium ochraceum DSM 14365]
MDPQPAHKLGALQSLRANGEIRISFKTDRDGKSRLGNLYHRMPLRVLMSQVAPEEPPQGVLVTTSGGLAGGDRIAVHVEVEAGAQATLSTQAAEKVYGAGDYGPCHADAHLRLGPGARLAWLPQETILFDDARLRRACTIDVAADARVLAVESLVLGREARGEHLCSGELRERWRVRRGGRLVWMDALRVDDWPARRAARFGLAEVRAMATVVVVAPRAEQYLDDARALLAEVPHAGASVPVPGVLVARLLAPASPPLRARLQTLLARLRHRVLEGPERLPRIWNT